MSIAIAIAYWIYDLAIGYCIYSYINKREIFNIQIGNISVMPTSQSGVGMAIKDLGNHFSLLIHFRNKETEEMRKKLILTISLIIHP